MDERMSLRLWLDQYMWTLGCSTSQGALRNGVPPTASVAVNSLSRRNRYGTDTVLPLRSSVALEEPKLEEYPAEVESSRPSMGRAGKGA